MSIFLEVNLRHLAAHDVESFSLIHILSRLPLVVHEEAYAQLFAITEDSLQRPLYTVQVQVVSQLRDVRTIVLHHIWELQAVIEHAQL